jgi:hypothetical protein
MKHIIYQGVRITDVPAWVNYVGADSSGEIYGFTDEPQWITTGGKNGCWRARSGQVGVLGHMDKPRATNTLIEAHQSVEDAEWALAVLDAFEYGIDGTIKRYPGEDIYGRAMQVLTKVVETHGAALAS